MMRLDFPIHRTGTNTVKPRFGKIRLEYELSAPVKERLAALAKQYGIPEAEMTIRFRKIRVRKLQAIEKQLAQLDGDVLDHLTKVLAAKAQPPQKPCWWHK